MRLSRVTVFNLLLVAGLWGQASVRAYAPSKDEKRGTAKTQVSTAKGKAGAAAPTGTTRGAALFAETATAPITPLTERALWQGASIYVGNYDPLRQRITIDGNLAVVPALAPLGGRARSLASTDSAAQPAAAQLMVVDLSEGRVLRHIEVPGQAQRLPLGVALDNNRAVFATEDGYVAKVDLDGSYAWVVPTGSTPLWPPLLAQVNSDATLDVVLVTSGTLHAYDGATGTLLWEAQTPSCQQAQLWGPPPWSLPQLLLQCDGQSLAYDLNKGTQHSIQEPTEPAFQLLGLLDTRDQGTCLVEASPLALHLSCGAGVEGLSPSLRLTAGTMHPPKLLNFSVPSAVPAEAARASILGTDVVQTLVSVGEQLVVREDPRPYATASLGYADDNALIDLLYVTEEGYLRGDETLRQGPIHQAMPWGDLSANGWPPPSYIKPQASSAQRIAATAERAQLQGFQNATAALAKPDYRWGAERWLRNLADAGQPLVVSRPSPDSSIPTQHWPLGPNVHWSGETYIAHDRANIAAGPDLSELRPVRWHDAVESTAATPSIQDLAALGKHLIIAHDGQLTTCQLQDQSCQVVRSSNGAATALASDRTHGRVWVATAGQLRRFNPGAGQGSAWDYTIPGAGPVDKLQVVGGYLIASGPEGSVSYLLQDAGLPTDPIPTDLELTDVVRCSDAAPFYALSQGELLSADRRPAEFVRVHPELHKVRALGCDGPDLMVLSAEQGLLRLPGPIDSGWLPWTTILVICGLLLGLQVVRSYWHRPTRRPGASTPVRLGIRTDQPLTRYPQHAPKLRALVQALARFIDNEDTKPPVTVGVYGPWGSGKSSVMRLLQYELGKRRRYIRLWFNPWRFHREEDIAVALLQSVVSEIRRQAGLGKVHLALQRVTHPSTLLTLSWLVPLLLFGLHMLLFPDMWSDLGLNELLSELEPEATKGSTPTAWAGGSLFTIGGLVTLFRLGRRVFKVFDLNPAELLREGDPQKRVDFFQHFSDELKQVLDALPRGQRVVVFVDDLDRCQPKQVVGMLEALNLLTESQRAYFVLGMDPRLVRSAVEVQHQDLLELKAKNGEDVSGFGARYLEKIVTLAIHVPEVVASSIEDELLRESQADASERASREQVGARRSWATRLREPERFLPLTWLLCCLTIAGLAFSSARTTATIAWLDADSSEAAEELPGAEADATPPPETPATESTPTGLGPYTRPAAAPPSSADLDQAPVFRRPLLADDSPTTSAPSPPRPLATNLPDAPYTQSKHMRGLVTLFSGLCTLTFLFLIYLLQRRRSILSAVEPKGHDSPAFKQALGGYLQHVGPNPRRIIRCANGARFLYYLMYGSRPWVHGPDQDDNTEQTNTFFASLLAEQQARTIVGNEVSGPRLVRHVVERTIPPEAAPDAKERLQGLYDSWPPQAALVLDKNVDEARVVELRGWLRDTHV